MKTGLVLSGGGVRGIAHIGVIKGLEENNIHPLHIAGIMTNSCLQNDFDQDKLILIFREIFFF